MEAVSLSFCFWTYLMQVVNLSLCLWTYLYAFELILCKLWIYLYVIFVSEFRLQLHVIVLCLYHCLSWQYHCSLSFLTISLYIATYLNAIVHRLFYHIILVEHKSNKLTKCSMEYHKSKHHFTTSHNRTKDAKNRDTNKISFYHITKINFHNRKLRKQPIDTTFIQTLMLPHRHHVSKNHNKSEGWGY